MSTWRIITKALYAVGGGPVHTSVFDPLHMSYGTFWDGIERARHLGMVENTVSGWGVASRGRWALTQAGIDWCEGRLGDEYRHKRLFIVATWLKALPQTNQIRLGVM